MLGKLTGSDKNKLDFGTFAKSDDKGCVTNMLKSGSDRRKLKNLD